MSTTPTFRPFTWDGQAWVITAHGSVYRAVYRDTDKPVPLDGFKKAVRCGYRMWRIDATYIVVRLMQKPAEEGART